ncbi:FxsB family cyclophane-forming radical SAM/SPASM peptide maturase [Streptomyces sp. NPDC002328]|uniref:FxsB family cyclophane-forming radical SAM/SPASM peptide maturase n=1 Tax=Streptomyces sp. NPDC002328 TaxID=3364642 RepID=UPI003674147D
MTADGFRQFVLKVHSRCNLACTYCYIYRSPDRSWRDRPHRVAERTMRRTAHRVAEHARTHALRAVRVDLHGGEPLLTGPETALAYADLVRTAAPDGTEVTVTVQTNGTLLTAPVLDRLADAGVRIGLSLDGGTARLNARRVDHAGRPSWPAARAAARLLAERRPDAYAGILCTVDPATDPTDVYTSLRALAPPSLDFLLPHRNWGDRTPGRHRPAPTPYGDWLATAFDLWWADHAPDRPRVRLFTDIMALLLGGSSRSDAVGLSPMTAVVVETDGGIERIDSLKTAFAGAPALGLDVFRDSFDDALRHPRIAALRAGAAALGEDCRACPVVRVCGGGSHAHRYAPPSGHFRHPSVHCPDLEHIIRHAAERMGEQLSVSPRSLV